MGADTTPVVGATEPHHLDDAIASVSRLSGDELDALEMPYSAQPGQG